MSPHPGTLFTAQLFNKASYSNITIRIGEQEIPCHKLVICRFEYFNKLCGADSRFAEAKQDTIELLGDAPNAAKAVIQYMYTGHYYDSNDRCKYDWQFHLRVTTAANKYLLRELESTSFSIFLCLLESINQPAPILDAIHTIEKTCIDPEILEIADDLRTEHMSSFLRSPELAKQLSEASIKAYYLKVEAFQKGFVKVEALVCPNCARRKHVVDGDIGNTICIATWCRDRGYQSNMKLRRGSEYWAANYADAKEMAKALDKLSRSQSSARHMVARTRSGQAQDEYGFNYTPSMQV